MRDADSIREYHKTWVKNNPEKVRAAAARSRGKRGSKDKLKHRYNIDVETRDALATHQWGRCAICESDDVKLCVDHSHKTGVVRGLLCIACNTGIGMLRDSPELLANAINYLRREPPNLLDEKDADVFAGRMMA
jgi:hypothetical protein